MFRRLAAIARRAGGHPRRTLFAFLALLQLIPIWSVHYLPTADGPAHLYNAWLVKESVAGRPSDYFEVDARPLPNWSDHAVLALLMTIVPATIAEKLFVSAIILLFLYGASVFAAGEVYAFLAFPLVFHQFMQSGFFNFSLSVALFLLILGLWRRKQDVIAGALLVVCYFSHPMSTMLAVGSLVVLWIFRENRRWRDLLALVPAIALLGWYTTHQQMSMAGRAGTPAQLFEALRQTQIIFNFDLRQFTFGKLFFALLIVLTITTIAFERRFRRDDAFLLLTLIVLVFYIRAPGIAAGGTLVAERLSLFVYLLPLAWFTPRLPRFAQATLAVALAVTAILNAGFHLHHYRHYDRVIADFVSAVKPIAPNSTLLPLLFVHDVHGSYVSVIAHAVDYVAIEKHVTDFDNYEPRVPYFPIRYRPGVSMPKPSSVESQARTLDFTTLKPQPQYLFLWMPDRDVIDQVEKAYHIIAVSAGGRLYVRTVPF
jgi:hypothetical protein